MDSGLDAGVARSVAPLEQANATHPAKNKLDITRFMVATLFRRCSSMRMAVKNSGARACPRAVVVNGAGQAPGGVYTVLTITPVHGTVFMAQPKHGEGFTSSIPQSALDEALESVERMEAGRKASPPEEATAAPAAEEPVRVEVDTSGSTPGTPAAVPHRTPQDAIIEALIRGKAEAQEALRQTQKEAKDLLEARTRTQADFENFKRRTQKEKQDLQLHAATNLVKELLPVLDNFERALATSKQGGADPSSLLEGIRMVQRQMLDVLRRHGVEPFTSQGQPFDPARHEAVSQVPAPSGSCPGTVLEEQQKGYMLHDRLLRPALVVVAGPPVAAGSTP